MERASGNSEDAPEMYVRSFACVYFAFLSSRIRVRACFLLFVLLLSNGVDIEFVLQDRFDHYFGPIDWLIFFRDGLVLRSGNWLKSTRQRVLDSGLSIRTD